MKYRIYDYIRANRHTYTRGAIDEKLRAEGYSQEDIEAAWYQVLETASARAEGGGGGAGLGCLIAALVTVGVALLGLTNLVLYGWPAWFVNLGSLVVLVGLIMAGSRLRDRRDWSASQIAGLVAAVTIVWYLIVAGTCIYGPSLL